MTYRAVSFRIERKTQRLLALFLFGGALVAGSAMTFLAQAEIPHEGYAPDPTPSPTTRQWTFDIDVQTGAVKVTGVHSKTLDKAEPTARMMGRFAIELWLGNELVDRIRFNIPGMGEPPPQDPKSRRKHPDMTRTTTHMTVKMADSGRATSARLVDRATGEETVIPWPPDGAVDAKATPSAAPSATGSASPSASSSPPAATSKPAPPPRAPTAKPIPSINTTPAPTTPLPPGPARRPDSDR